MWDKASHKDLSPSCAVERGSLCCAGPAWERINCVLQGLRSTKVGGRLVQAGSLGVALLAEISFFAGIESLLGTPVKVRPPGALFFGVPVLALGLV